MSWKLLEEDVTEDKGNNNPELEQILRNNCARLGKIESSTLNLSISQDLKNELEAIPSR